MTRFRHWRTAIIAALTAFSLLVVTPVAMAQSRQMTLVGWHKCGTFKGTLTWNGWHWYWGLVSHFARPRVHLEGTLYSTCRGYSTVYLSYFDGFDRNWPSSSVAAHGKLSVDIGHSTLENPQSIAVAVCTASIKPRGWYCRTRYL
jgi:hypothetical protein